MKKKFVAIMLCSMLSVSMLSGCGEKADSGSKTVAEDVTEESWERCQISFT